MGVRYSPSGVWLLMRAKNSGSSAKKIAIKMLNGMTPIKEVNIPKTTPEVISEAPSWCLLDQAFRANQRMPKWIVPFKICR